MRRRKYLRVSINKQIECFPPQSFSVKNQSLEMRDAIQTACGRVLPEPQRKLSQLNDDTTHSKTAKLSTCVL